ncbi:MAG: sigma-70 family RNA polymerase sigma factor [Acidimicrobiales bacterium]
MDGASTASLVAAAAAGESAAWDGLVARFAGLVWSIPRDFGLASADAADVSQTTWLRLAEHLDRIREPNRVGSWLAATARNESVRTLRRAQWQRPVDPASPSFVREDGQPAVDNGILEAERDDALWRAFESLSSPCKVLLRTLMADPTPSYVEVSALLDMPVGSIGPNRNRCLDRLRRRAEFARPLPKSARSSTVRRAVG